jgi:hypothetical protein
MTSQSRIILTSVQYSAGCRAANTLPGRPYALDQAVFGCDVIFADYHDLRIDGEAFGVNFAVSNLFEQLFGVDYRARTDQ